MAENVGLRRVVVGVDGSLPSLYALRWAAQEARRRGADLCAVVVDADVAAPQAPYAPATSPDAGAGRWTALGRQLVDAITAALGPCPDLPIHEHVEEGRPGEVLCRYSRGAEALVVGSRWREAPAGSALSSVVRACIRGAACPVVVVSHDPMGSAPSPGSPVAELAAAVSAGRT